jgi:hypothetical protein
MFNAKVVENFLSIEDLKIVLDYAKLTDKWGDGGDDYWKGRVLSMQKINNDNKQISLILFNLLMKQKEYILSNYDLNTMIYSDTFALVKWLPGHSQPPHSDNMIDTIDHIIHKHREYGSIVYLNNNFSGGETFYPQHNISIVPKPGMLAIHPADSNHMHGVSEIKDGIRYTIASFWTFDKERSNECVTI